MSDFSLRKTMGLFLAVGILLGSPAWLLAADPSLEGLLGSLNASAFTFITPSPATVKRESQATLEKLRTARAKLEGAHGFEADDIFHLADLDTELSSAKPDIAKLETIYRGLCTNLTQPIDLGDRQWSTVRLSLYKLLRLLRASAESDPQARLAEHKRQLISQISACQPTASSSAKRSAFAKMAESYRWCVERGQVPHEMSLLRTYFRGTNSYLVIDNDFIKEMIQVDMSQTTPIHKSVKGISVDGMGIGRGKVTGQFGRNPDRGEIRLTMNGTADAHNVRAKMAKATVWLDSHSTISGYQAVYLNSDLSVSVGPKSFTVDTVTNPHSSHWQTHGLLSGRLRARIALRVAQGKAGEMDAQTSAEIKQELSEKVTAQVQEKLQTFKPLMEKLISEQFLFPFERQQLAPSFHIKSDFHALMVEGVFGSEEDLTATTGFPRRTRIHEKSDVRAYIHESLFNNINRFVAGGKVDEAEFREKFFKKLGLVIPVESDGRLEQLNGKPRPGGSITLVDHHPSQVVFENGQMEATLRLSAFKADRKNYRDRVLAIRTTYVPTIHQANRVRGGVLLTRGKLEILDGVTAEPLEPGSAKDVDALLSIAGHFFVRQTLAEGMKFDKELKAVGKIVATDIEIAKGWFIVCWKREGLKK